ncbi:SubName: Full=Uncharacterized protein {ECO:0000313/EMBL:CCA68010.1} [Serendipita indica DSM 11827]|nr:SubName: Full=Uncharacterized protein {ECO:0000313/EMBL:CCA68010.1} [Serendipita indica DSM 11827]
MQRLASPLKSRATQFSHRIICNALPTSSRTLLSTPVAYRQEYSTATESQHQASTSSSDAFTASLHGGETAQPSELPRQKTTVSYPYFVPRNTNGAIPVYSDFKNSRTRELVHIRNVEGDLQALKEDLIATLFPEEKVYGPEIRKLKNGVRIHQNRHIVIQGGPWVKRVHKWLLARGF